MKEPSHNSALFGPQVLVFDPSMPASDIQRRVDAVFAEMESNEFGAQRHCFLFLPGTYSVDVNVGFYTHVAGLGTHPDDVVIRGSVHSDATWDKGNATRNFWRAAENLCIEPPSGTDRWAVSQAAPYRRIHLKGDLQLDHGGWSSGGFLADCVIEGTVRSGGQQQWLSRNSRLGRWEGSNWNMVFAGVDGAPSGDTWPAPPHTVFESTPLIREKPFLVCRDGLWSVFVPAARREARGPSWDGRLQEGQNLPLELFHIARPGETPAALNAALEAGKHLLFTPGFYALDETLRVTKPGTVVLGIGLATLLPVAGNTVLTVADVEGVRIAGLLFDAGERNSPSLLEVGQPGASAEHSDPISLHDLFFRVGGATLGRASASLVIHSSRVLGDHFWVWRADHGRPGTVGWDLNTAANGLVVNGDEVTVYGLFVEHYQEYQTLWNGEGGRVWFYQSEIPYDPPEQDAYRRDGAGFASYKVADGVKDHRAWALGVYCFFKVNPALRLGNAVEAPEIGMFERITTVSLGGVGEISHVVNGRGDAVNASHHVTRFG